MWGASACAACPCVEEREKDSVDDERAKGRVSSPPLPTAHASSALVGPGPLALSDACTDALPSEERSSLVVAGEAVRAARRWRFLGGRASVSPSACPLSVCRWPPCGCGWGEALAVRAPLLLVLVLVMVRLCVPWCSRSKGWGTWVVAALCCPLLP